MIRDQSRSPGISSLATSTLRSSAYSVSACRCFSSNLRSVVRLWFPLECSSSHSQPSGAQSQGCGCRRDLPDASATDEIETAAQVEEEENKDSPNSNEPDAVIEDLRQVTPAKIWRLRLHALELWFPLPRPTEEGSLFRTNLQSRFHLAYTMSRMDLFPHMVVDYSMLVRTIDMTRE